MSQTAIVITFTHPKQLEYLQQVFDAHTRNGIPAGELPLAADTYVAIMNAREIPLTQNLGKATIAEAGPKGVALEFEASDTPMDAAGQL